MTLILQLVANLLAAVFPAVMERMQDTAEDGSAQPELKSRLRARIAETWGSALTAILICATACILGGCFTRTVYVPAGEPVRLRETIKSAKIWAVDKNGKVVPGRMDLKEGWFALDNPTDKN